MVTQVNASANGAVDSQIGHESIECGKAAAKHFAFGDGYRNLNHGSFGTYPRAIRTVLRDYQDQCEARPDQYIRYEYPKLLDESRETIARYLNAPVSACVFIPNATTGVNTVLRNLVYKPGDVILYSATIYGACEKTVEYITETTPAESYEVKFTYPASDDAIISAYEEAISTIRAQCKNPKMAIFDTIVSMPGVRVPFERLTTLCKQRGVLSCIDGAHGIGHIRLDLSALDPDFFVSNCHKWLYVPRGCALFYVPERNQAMMRSSLPTSHGFVPRPKDGKEAIINPLPPSAKSKFEENFEFTGTIDNNPYLCVPAAIAWRNKLTWQGQSGEEVLTKYTQQLARKAGDRVSQVLGTEVMENADMTLGKCNFSNVRLPLSYAGDAGGDHGIAISIAQWIARVLVEEHNTFIATMFYNEAWWVRLSSQVYLEVDDFDWGAKVLHQVCTRVKNGDWKR